MNSPMTEETTRRPPHSLRPETPAALFVRIPRLPELVKLRPREDEAHLAFLARLRFSTTPEEAVTYTAFAAKGPSAAGWGYECLRLMAGNLQPHEGATMQQIAAWLANPTTRLRHQIMKEALWAPARGPSVLLALAVGWSTGTPAPNDPDPSPTDKTPVAVNSAVLSCLARVPLSQRPICLARILDMAETLFGAGP